MNKVFCIGELLIDFIGKDINIGIENGINFEKKAGGAPANVAAAISKLGGKAAFLGQVGEDSFGRFLVKILEKVNVDIEMIKKKGKTTLAFVAIDENGERDFEFNRGSDGEYRFESIDLKKITSEDIIHFGSATGFLEGELKRTYYKLLEYANKNNIFVSFDPNYRDTLIKEEALEDYIKDCKYFIRNSDFMKLSDEEIKLITKEEDLNKGILKLHDLGAKIISVTLGEKGTMLSIEGITETISSIKIKQIDSTGAGDAFVGAVLKKISNIENKKNIDLNTWKNIIEYANKVGAITCTNYGAIDSMPTEKDLEKLR